MDIPSLSINMANSKLSQNVSISMMKKAMDQMEQSGEQIVDMIKSAEIPTDSTIDIKM